jgi:hypothetical protein
MEWQGISKKSGNENFKATTPIQIMIDKKQQGNVAYFNNLGSLITNDARCTRDSKSTTAMARAAFIKEALSPKNGLQRKNLVKCCVWSITVYGAETWTLQEIHKKYHESFEMWY